MLKRVAFALALIGLMTVSTMAGDVQMPPCVENCPPPPCTEGCGGNFAMTDLVPATTVIDLAIYAISRR